MKRLLALLLSLLLLTITALCLIGADISSQQDRVTLTERALYGDPAAAEGAVIGQQAHLRQHLLWEITHTPGEGTKTEYLFSTKTLSFPQDPHVFGVRMYDKIRFGYDGTLSAEETTGIALAYRELYEDTAPGTRGTRMVRLQDYYDYYPIQLDIQLPGTLWHGLDYEDMTEDGFANERAVWDAFTEFFRIPVPEDLPAFEISIVKSENGHEIGTGSSAAKDAPSYSLYTTSAHTSSACFFTINNRYGDKLVNTDLIPGGYGIYRVNYRNVRNEKNTQGNATVYHPGYDTGIDAASLAMVYPLEEEVQVLSMQVDPTEQRLLAITQDGSGKVSMLVIDIATMTATQSIPVTENAHVSLNHQDGFLVLFYERTISVYTVDGNGRYLHALTAPQPGDIDGTFADINTYAAVDFDGERLILADILLETQYRTMQTCGFCLAVYDGSGLLYYGEYDSSLSVNPNTSFYSDNCFPERLTVSWQQ